MMQRITPVVLILHPDHNESQDSEKQEIPHAHTKNRLYLEPLVRKVIRSIYPYIPNAQQISQLW